MAPKAFFLLSFFLVLSFCNLSAQTVSNTSTENILIIKDISLIGNDAEWAFFEDEQEQKVYIDFAELGGNFAELVVQDTEGNEVIKEDLFNMPSDSIYELDFSELTSGEYTLELKTFTQPILRTISVK